MDALKPVLVPDLGDFADVPVIEILVAVGDEVAAEDPLVAIESDKATMEIPAPFAGVVREILVGIGDKVSEGTPIVKLEEGGAASDAAASDASERAGAEAPGAGAAQVAAQAGDGASEAGAEPAVAGAAQAAQANGRGARGAVEVPARAGSVYASPLVRRRAREQGIDLRALTGSGRGGRVTLEDVERALGAGAAAGVGGADAAGAGGFDALGLAPWPSVDFERYGEVERVPLSRIQKLSAANLARNWVRIPHVTHNEDADVTELEAFRRRLNSEQADVKVTMVALLLKACASALQAFPRFNSSLDGDELVLKRYYHLGFAADTPQGLVVPVVRDVDGKGLLEIAAELTELSAKARAGRLGPAEMSGATFTVSSLGGIGGTSFTPIVNAPEVAILGAVRTVTRPVWDGEGFQPRLMLPLSLSYDHRVIDGAAAARFCAHLAGLLADMRRVLL